MKYAIIVPDGCADETLAELGDRSPLAAACTPAMDQIAKEGIVGRSSNVPDSLGAGSDVANLSLLGYNPLDYFTGRAPLEAAAQRIEMGPDDWAVRCNLVTIEDGVMRDFTAGHISTEEATELLRDAQPQMGDERIEFFPGVSYRNLMLIRGEKQPVDFSEPPKTVPPHDITDQKIDQYLPHGPGGDLLQKYMQRSAEIFADHPINKKRLAEGKKPVTHVWLWSLGRMPTLEPFLTRYGVEGAMITGVDLLRGLASLVGWKVIDVEGATAYLDTDYAAKGRAAIESLKTTDLIFVHVEAPDEASHEGRVDAKVESIERIDELIVAPVHEALKQSGDDYRILVTPDHPTLIRTKTHGHGYVPWTMCGNGIDFGGIKTYSDESAAESSVVFDEGWRLMSTFLR